MLSTDNSRIIIRGRSNNNNNNNNNSSSNNKILRMYLFLPLLVSLLISRYGHALKLENAMQLLNGVESIDPDIINFFSRRTPSSMYRNDVSEIDLSEVDTNDMISCFATLSYTCFQKKILVFVDSLSKVDRINVFGGYISFLRVGKPYVQPPITEDILSARGINDAKTLSVLLGRVFDDFIENRVVRITVPGINARLDSFRSLSSSSVPNVGVGSSSCFEFSLADIPIGTPGGGVTTTVETARNANNSTKENPEDEAATEKEKGRLQTQQACARGDNGMMVLSSALIMKMILLVPTLLKVVAAKTFFGIMMGILSLILSKMALLPYFLAPHKEYQRHHHLVGPSYKQQIYAAAAAPPAVTSTSTTTTSAPTLVADNYAGYYPGLINGGPIIGAGAGPFMGPTAVMGPSGPHIYDAVWSDHHNGIREDEENDDGGIMYSSIKRHSGGDADYNVGPIMAGKKVRQQSNHQLQSQHHLQPAQQSHNHPHRESYHLLQQQQQQQNQYNFDGYKSKRVYPTTVDGGNSITNGRSAAADSAAEVDYVTAQTLASSATAATSSTDDHQTSTSPWIPSKAVPPMRMKRWFSWL